MKKCIVSKVGILVGAVSLAATAMGGHGSVEQEMAKNQNEQISTEQGSVEQGSNEQISTEQGSNEQVSREQGGKEQERFGNQLDFETLKAKCLELTSNQQLKPFKAIVTCRDTKYVWRPSKDQDYRPLPNLRSIGASIRMKGFETPSSEQKVPVEASQVACAVMEKYKITVPSVDAELSCDDLNAINNLTEFCLEQISNRTQEDPSLVIEEATGDRLSTCGNASYKH